MTPLKQITEVCGAGCVEQGRHDFGAVDSVESIPNVSADGHNVVLNHVLIEQGLNSKHSLLDTGANTQAKLDAVVKDVGQFDIGESKDRPNSSEQFTNCDRADTSSSLGDWDETSGAECFTGS